MDELNEIKIPSNLKHVKNDIGIHIYGFTGEECIRYNSVNQSIFKQKKVYIIIDAIKDKVSSITTKTYFLATNPTNDELLLNKSKTIIKKLIELDEKKTDMISILIIVNPNLRPDKFNRLLKTRNSILNAAKLSADMEEEDVMASKPIKVKRLKPKTTYEYINELSNQNYPDTNIEGNASSLKVKEIKRSNSFTNGIKSNTLVYIRDDDIKIHNEVLDKAVVKSLGNAHKDISKNQENKIKKINKIKYEDDIREKDEECNIDNIKSIQKNKKLFAKKDSENSLPSNESNSTIRSNKHVIKLYNDTYQGTDKENEKKTVKNKKKDLITKSCKTISYKLLYAEKQNINPKMFNNNFNNKTEITKDSFSQQETGSIQKLEELIREKKPRVNLNEIISVPKK